MTKSDKVAALLVLREMTVLSLLAALSLLPLLGGIKAQGSPEWPLLRQNDHFMTQNDHFYVTFTHFYRFPRRFTGASGPLYPQK